jgi:hypothetical protein
MFKLFEKYKILNRVEMSINHVKSTKNEKKVEKNWKELSSKQAKGKKNKEN